MIHRAYNKFFALKPKNGSKTKKCSATTQQLCLSAITRHLFLLRMLNFVLTVRTNILWTVGHACCTAASQVRPSITRLMANQWPETHKNVQYKGLWHPLCPPLHHFIFILKADLWNHAVTVNFWRMHDMMYSWLYLLSFVKRDLLRRWHHLQYIPGQVLQSDLC